MLSCWRFLSQEFANRINLEDFVLLNTDMAPAWLQQFLEYWCCSSVWWNSRNWRIKVVCPQVHGRALAGDSWDQLIFRFVATRHSEFAGIGGKERCAPCVRVKRSIRLTLPLRCSGCVTIKCKPLVVQKKRELVRLWSISRIS